MDLGKRAIILIKEEGEDKYILGHITSLSLHRRFDTFGMTEGECKFEILGNFTSTPFEELMASIMKKEPTNIIDLLDKRKIRLE